jgi:hypothetical protein
MMSLLVLMCGAASPAVAQEFDLASDSAWKLSVDGGPERPIKVPGGGWNSDLQEPRIPTMTGVDDFVIYRRSISVPKISDGQISKIFFEAVNYGAEVYIDGQLVGSHAGPQTPFEIDVTRFVTPGKRHELTVKAYHRRHYIRGDGKRASVPVAFDFSAGSEKWCHWAGNTKYSYGITKSVVLKIYPAVSIRDIFVRPSVTDDTLTIWAWVTNSTDRACTVLLKSALSSWNGDDWHYPQIPAISAELAPGECKKLIQSVKWGLGRESFWWPNMPFREDYRAKLHYLDLELSADGHRLDKRRQRFGFVEWGEGKYYYTVNGVRINLFSDSSCESQMSYYDCYALAPAFLPPDPAIGRKGCPETWKRYMRLGMNINRIACSTPTEYMMNAADEVGFMLVPESPIWGNHLHQYNPKVTPLCIQALGRFCRNHPSVARYSLTNEVRPKERNLVGSPWIDLIGAMKAVDDLRPLSYDLHRCGQGRVEDGRGGHAYIMEHYAKVVPSGGRFRALGESCWETDGILNWAYTIRELRMNDWAYGSCWAWVNYWPNFFEGMSHDKHAWQPQNAPDRTDGLNGWDSPVVRFFQKSTHPYLLIDHEIRGMHTQAPRREVGDGSLTWPRVTSSYTPGSDVVREIELFNGGLTDGDFRLLWEARFDQADGPVLASGKTGPVKIKAGFHASRKIKFTLPPKTLDADRRIYIVMRSEKDGRTVFTENRIWVKILSKQRK